MASSNLHQTTESLHARVPQEIVGELDRIATSLGRSRNWVFNEALQQYLETQQWQLDLIKNRFREAENKNATFVVHDQLMDRQEKRLKKKLRL